MTQAWLNHIGTAVPPHDVHAAFVEFGGDTIADPHKRALFDRMAKLSDIEHRYAIFEPGPKPRDKILDASGFYRRGAFPSTAARMALYEPPLVWRGVSMDHPLMLEEGMVVALETQEYDGLGQGVRIEEVVLITADGPEILTKWPIDQMTVVDL